MPTNRLQSKICRRNSSSDVYDQTMEVERLPYGERPAPQRTAFEYFYDSFMKMFPLAYSRSRASRRNLEENVDLAWRVLSEEDKVEFDDAEIRDLQRFNIQQSYYLSSLTKTEEYKERNRVNKEDIHRKESERQKIAIEIAREKNRKFLVFKALRNAEIDEERMTNMARKKEVDRKRNEIQQNKIKRTAEKIAIDENRKVVAEGIKIKRADELNNKNILIANNTTTLEKSNSLDSINNISKIRELTNTTTNIKTTKSCISEIGEHSDFLKKTIKEQSIVKAKDNIANRTRSTIKKKFKENKILTNGSRKVGITKRPNKIKTCSVNVLGKELVKCRQVSVGRSSTVEDNNIVNKINSSSRKSSIKSIEQNTNKSKHKEEDQEISTVTKAMNGFFNYVYQTAQGASRIFNKARSSDTTIKADTYAKEKDMNITTGCRENNVPLSREVKLSIPSKQKNIISRTSKINSRSRSISKSKLNANVCRSRKSKLKTSTKNNNKISIAPSSNTSRNRSRSAIKKTRSNLRVSKSRTLKEMTSAKKNNRISRTSFINTTNGRSRSAKSRLRIKNTQNSTPTSKHRTPKLNYKSQDSGNIKSPVKLLKSKSNISQNKKASSSNIRANSKILKNKTISNQNRCKNTKMIKKSRTEIINNRPYRSRSALDRSKSGKNKSQYKNTKTPILTYKRDDCIKYNKSKMSKSNLRLKVKSKKCQLRKTAKKTINKSKKSKTLKGRISKSKQITKEKVKRSIKNNKKTNIKDVIKITESATTDTNNTIVKKLIRSNSEIKAAIEECANTKQILIDNEKNISDSVIIQEMAPSQLNKNNSLEPITVMEKTVSDE